MDQNEFDSVMQSLEGRPCMFTNKLDSYVKCGGELCVIASKTQIRSSKTEGKFVFCRNHAEDVLINRMAWEILQVNTEGTAILPIDGLTIEAVQAAQEGLVANPTKPNNCLIWVPETYSTVIRYRMPAEYVGTILSRIQVLKGEWSNIGWALYYRQCGVEDSGDFVLKFDSQKEEEIRSIIEGARQGYWGREVRDFMNQLVEILPEGAVK